MTTKCVLLALYILLFLRLSTQSADFDDCTYACINSHDAENKNYCKECAPHSPLLYRACVHVCGESGGVYNPMPDALCIMCFKHRANMMRNICQYACRSRNTNLDDFRRICDHPRCAALLHNI